MFNRNKLIIIAGETQCSGTIVKQHKRFFKRLFEDENEVYSYLGAVGRKTNAFGDNDSIGVETLCYNIRMNLLS